MAVGGSRSAAQRARAEAERARLYAARTGWHEQQLRRRRRDTVIAVVVGGLIVIGAIASQSIHAQVTAPDPTVPTAPASDLVTPTSVPETPAPSEMPSPSETPSPSEAPASPAPTQTSGE